MMLRRSSCRIFVLHIEVFYQNIIYQRQEPQEDWLEEVTNLNIHRYLAGHLGGEQQLGAQIENNDIDLVIFLRDPLTKKSHEPDADKVMRLCDTHNIPLATNLATAELLIMALDRGDFEFREAYR